MLTTKQKFLILFTAIATYALIFLDESGIAVTLTQIQKALQLPSNTVHWIVNSYLLTLSVLMLLGGRLCDKFGVKLIFILGLLVFIVASFFCGAAQSGLVIILAQLTLGVGASLLLPAIFVILSQSFPANQLGKALGVVLGFSNFFYAVGPFVAGLLTQYLTWRWFFWINIPVGLFCILIASVVVKAQKGNNNISLNLKECFILIIALCSLVVALMQGGEWGWDDLKIIFLLLASLIFFTLLVFVELKTKDPLIDLQLFANKAFSAGNIILFCETVCLSSIVFIALWIQNVLNFSPMTVGFALLPATLPFVFMPTITGIWADKKGPRNPINLGNFLILISLVWMGITAFWQNYSLFCFGLILFGLGVPLTIPASCTALMAAVKPEQSGMASGILNSTRQLALSIGIAIFSAVLSSYNNLKMMQLTTQPNYSHFNLQQLNLLISQGPTNSQLRNILVEIYTHGFVCSIFVMIAIGIVGCIVGYFFIEKKTNSIINILQ